MTVFVEDKESLKNFILNYHLIESEETEDEDIEVDDFFQIDDSLSFNTN